VVTGLNRACTAQHLIAVKNIMNEFIAFMSNAAVVTKDRSGPTDVILGG
jgi:nucleoside permease NupC